MGPNKLTQMRYHAEPREPRNRKQKARGEASVHTNMKLTHEKKKTLQTNAQESNIGNMTLGIGSVDHHP